MENEFDGLQLNCQANLKSLVEFKEDKWVSLIALAALGLFWRAVTYIAMYIVSNPIKPDIKPFKEIEKSLK